MTFSKNLTITAAAVCVGVISSVSSAAIVYQAEFNTNGNTQGWGPTATSSSIVSGSVNVTGGTFNATASGGDPRLAVSGLNLTVTPPDNAWQSIIFRVREKTSGGVAVTTFSSQGLIVQANGVTVPGSTFTAVSSTDDFFIVTGDISQLSTANPITSLRLDPIGGNAANATMEIDYIHLTAIPEPASLAALGLGALCMGRRRRR